MTDTNTTLDKEAVLALLASVEEPELGQSLTELKMIKDVTVDDGKVTVSIELPTPASTSKPKIQQDVTERLTQNGAREVDIVWTARVRSSSGGRMDAQPIKGVKNAICINTLPGTANIEARCKGMIDAMTAAGAKA